MADPSLWYVHDWNAIALHVCGPVSIHPFGRTFVFGPIDIRWYGLAYLAGLLSGWWLMCRWYAQGRSPLSPQRVQDFLLAAGLGMIIGGRVGYCLVYGLDHWRADPFYLFKLWEGGMASHGGIIGMALGSWWFARRHQVALPILTDLVSAAGPLGVLFGRLANYVNAELWGRPTDVPWAVWFPDAIRSDVVQALRDHQLFPPAGLDLGSLDAVRWLATQGITVLPRHPSQLYEAALEGVLLLAITLSVHARHRRPGLTTGAGLAAYGLVRVVGEFWRQHDPQAHPVLGLNYGQWLSFPMVVIGVAVMAWAWRRGPKPEAYQPPTTAAGN